MSSKKMISAVHHLKINGRSYQEIEDKLHRRADKLRKVPGFLFYRLLKPITPQDDYALLTFWQSRRHYQAALPKAEAALASG